MADHASVTVAPSPTLGGTLRVPGDKSISHRAAMLGALATGTSRLSGFLCSEDCLHTLGALTQLGAVWQREGTTVTLQGCGGAFTAPVTVLDMGNSGTGMRLLSGLLASQDFEVELTGDDSLRSRPMDRIRKPLAEMGATIELLGNEGRPPVRLHGGVLEPIRYELPVASAQIKSCVLLAALSTPGTTTVVEPRETRDHTERMLRAMGAELTVEGGSIDLTVPSGGVSLQARDFAIPGDFSSAAFWIVAAAMRPGSEVRLEGVGLNPRRTALLDVMRRMGADIQIESQTGADWEPAGTIVVRGRSLHGTVVEGAEIPNLIDELPLVAVAGALAQGRTVIREAAELRVKETDRIATVVENLQRLGVEVTAQSDGLVVEGGEAPRGGVALDSFGDHRIAMCMAVLGTLCREPVRIDNVACVQTSYPAFWDHLALLTQARS
jgi:3-phosphoshikimate 1-carboxyvinyltransferase